MRESEPLVAGIEAGGTKFNCLIGRGPGEIVAEIQFPTTNPEETIAHALDFFATNRAKFGAPAALGIASFGPVALDSASSAYGHITSTPKPGWRDIDILGPFAAALGCPIAFDTDVNGAVLAERRWGAAKDLDSFVYVTIGTGIGGGAMTGGRLVHGAMHPEIGHMLPPRGRVADDFAGICPFHGDCLEGLASGPAIEARWGQPGSALPPDHPAWELEAHYLALMCMNLSLALSPKRILLGGGVMRREHLFPLVRARFDALMAGYLAPSGALEDFIGPPGLGARAGALGALALAATAL